MTGAADRLAQAYQDRILTESTASLKTDEHISMYETLVKAQPEVPHYQNLLAGAYIQKVREIDGFQLSRPRLADPQQRARAGREELRSRAAAN